MTSERFPIGTRYTLPDERIAELLDHARVEGANYHAAFASATAASARRSESIALLSAAGMSIRDIADGVGISRTAVHRALKAHTEKEP